MARRFASGDSLTCAVGGANLSRAGTVIMLIRPYDAAFNALATNTDFVTGRSGSSAVWAAFLDGGKVFANNDFGAGLTGPSDKDTWYALGYTKASGTSTYRYHLRPVGGAWTHADSGTANDGSGVTDVLFGAGPIKGAARFEIAASATYAAAMSDGAIEAAITDDMADWVAAGPGAAWQFNQVTVADPVTDLTGGGADQTAITGTTVVADPAGWTYTGGAPPAAGMVDVGLTYTVDLAGSRRSAGSVPLALAYDLAITGSAPARGSIALEVAYAVGFSPAQVITGQPARLAAATRTAALAASATVPGTTVEVGP